MTQKTYCIGRGSAKTPPKKSLAHACRKSSVAITETPIDRDLPSLFGIQSFQIAAATLHMARTLDRVATTEIANFGRIRLN